MAPPGALGIPALGTTPLGGVDGNPLYLTSIVREATLLVDDSVEIFDLFEASALPPFDADAVICDIEAWSARRPSVPHDLHSALVDFLTAVPPSTRVTSVPPGFDVLCLGTLTRDVQVVEVARWLGRSVFENVTIDEHRMLSSAPVQSTRQQFALREEIRLNMAQVQAALSTIEIQLRAPKPSRRVLKWALSRSTSSR